jgi:hypothetical protein
MWCQVMARMGFFLLQSFLGYAPAVTSRVCEIGLGFRQGNDRARPSSTEIHHFDQLAGLLSTGRQGSRSAARLNNCY